MKTTILAFLLTLGLSSVPMMSQASELPQAEKQQLDADLAFLIAPIKSQKDVNEYLKSTASTKSPLRLLSDSGRKQFLSSLTFNDAGITGFSYASLESELTPTQIYQVLALFGTQSNTSMIKGARIGTQFDADIMLFGEHYNSEAASSKCFEPESSDPEAPLSKCAGGGKDYVGYRCVSRATCARSPGWICKSNC